MTFQEWWDEHGQYVRAGGGQYEISFAFAAWNAALEEAAICADSTSGGLVYADSIADSIRGMKEVA